jgi:hypothetical protein
MLPGGPVTLLPRRAPIGNSGPIRGRTLTVLPQPAMDAATSLPSDADRFDASIQPGDVPALAVADLDEDAAVRLGRALGLTEVFYWDGRRGRLLACH